MPNDTFPLARTHDLAIQEMKDETLVYDQRNHQAHCLNPLAAIVWKHCDGRRDKHDLAAIVQRLLDLPADPSVIDLSLHELSQADLLEQAMTMPNENKLYTRREIARKLGASSVAALVLAPLISSIVTQSAMAQASQTTTTAAPAKGPPA